VFQTSSKLTRRYAFCLMSFFGLAGLLVGCNTTGSSSVGGAGVANTLRYPIITDPTTMDPAQVRDGTTIDLLQQVYEGLVKWDDKNQIVPNVAEKWDVSKDGITYTFHLKHGVKFHHGREVNADDFKYSIERACDPAVHSPNLAYLNDIVGVKERVADKAEGIKPISGIRVVDPYTLEIKTVGFKPYWLGNMTYPSAYVVCKEVVEKGGGKITDANVVGTGPFMLEPGAYKLSDRVTLTANPDYHDGRPKLDSIVREILKDGNTRLSKFEANELDMVQISPANLEKVNNDPALKSALKSFPLARIWYIGMNPIVPADSPFAKPDVRKAFAMAIDKQQIVHVALHDQADIANGILVPGVLGYNPNVKPLPYDPKQAQDLLAKAGYPGGRGFPVFGYTYRNDQPEVQDVAEVIRQQIKTNLGIELQGRPIQWAQFLDETDKKSIVIGSLSWGADYLDPQNFLTLLLHTDHVVDNKHDHESNATGYSNAQFDKLCDEADVEHDQDKRIALYRQAEQLAIDDAAWVPLYFQKDLWLIRPGVSGYRSSLFGILPHTQTTVSP